MKKQSQYYYDQQPQVHLQRSSFNRSHSYKTVFDGGWLVPFFVDEVIPGDTFNHSSHFFGRLSTPVFPIMDNLWLEAFYFFVPNRLVWENWTKFMGDKPINDSTTYSVPTLKSTNVTDPATASIKQGSNFDYMGLPINVPNLEFNVLPFRAMNLIMNRWFLDENFPIQRPIHTGDAGDTFADYSTVNFRSKKRDYFTSALPWPQKGDSVIIPYNVGPTYAPVLGIAASNQTWATGPANGYDYDGAVSYSKFKTIDPASANTSFYVEAQAAPSDNLPNIRADLGVLSNLSTINDLREAFQLQKFLERDARGGTRYIESIFSHFGVVNPDFRLQEPELLTVHRQNIKFNPVAQTSSTDATTPQGNLSAFATTAGSSHYIKSFTEHGFILGFVNIRADLTYQQGLDRFWSRGASKYDYFWPEFAHLGEQAILNKEIYAQGDLVLDINGDIVDELPFGYIPRFDDYRYKPSQVTANMRSNAQDSFDQWHLAQDFSGLPELNGSFVSDLATLNGLARITAVEDVPQFILDCYHNLNCVRVMPTYAIPGFADHF